MRHPYFLWRRVHAEKRVGLMRNPGERTETLSFMMALDPA
jgi:hypothetical protein